MQSWLIRFAFILLLIIVERVYAMTRPFLFLVLYNATVRVLSASLSNCPLVHSTFQTMAHALLDICNLEMYAMIIEYSREPIASHAKY